MMKGHRGEPPSERGGSGTGDSGALGPGKRTRVDSIGSTTPGPIIPNVETRPEKIRRTDAGPSTTGGGPLVDYASDSDDDSTRRSPSPARSGSGPEVEREEHGGSSPELGLPKSSPPQREQAEAAVQAIQPYEGDWDTAQEAIVQDLARLQRFLTPPNADGGQWMWDDSDELLGILARGFLTIHDNIANNKPLNLIFTKQRGLQEGGDTGPLGNVRPIETFLTFLKTASYQCAQATDGSIHEWIQRIRDFKS